MYTYHFAIYFILVPHRFSYSYLPAFILIKYYYLCFPHLNKYIFYCYFSGKCTEYSVLIPEFFKNHLMKHKLYNISTLLKPSCLLHITLRLILYIFVNYSKIVLLLFSTICSHLPLVCACSRFPSNSLVSSLELSPLVKSPNLVFLLLNNMRLPL